MKIRLIIYSVLVILISVSFISILGHKNRLSSISFNGDMAYEYLAHQVSLGPRIPGSKAHQKVRSWITTQLENFGWNVELQSCEDCANMPIHNIVAKKGNGNPWILIGAHYDSRLYADQDTIQDNQVKPVPGANDGASGTSILLELSRIIPNDINKRIWLVFFDAEDNGRISTYDWCMGSKYFVEELVNSNNKFPDKVVIIDMVGDKDLNIYFEKNSDQEIMNEIWNTANDLGYDQFIPQPKYRIIDDHVPFLQAGIPAIDIIDFDYPFWHTTNDTIDKVSPDSLQVIGNTLMSWLLKTP